eukprot:COSAG04_NODE_26207_length_297_cov_0.582915_2_plen_24_part_01
MSGGTHVADVVDLPRRVQELELVE